MNVELAVNRILTSFQNTFEQFLEFLPKFLIFLAFLAVGFVLSKIVAVIVQKIARNFVGRFTSTATTSTTLDEIYTTSPIVLSKFVFWILFFFFIIAGVEALGFTALTKIASWITFYLPNLLAGLIILFVGIWAGNILGSFIERKGKRWNIEHPDYLAIASRWFIILVSISIALSQTGIHSQLINVIFGIGLACIFGSIALAFSLSVQDTLKDFIQIQTLKKEFNLGDTVKCDQYQGSIISFETTAIVIEMDGDKIRIPVDQLQDRVLHVDYQAKP